MSSPEKPRYRLYRYFDKWGVWAKSEDLKNPNEPGSVIRTLGPVFSLEDDDDFWKWVEDHF